MKLTTFERKKSTFELWSVGVGVNISQGGDSIEHVEGKGEEAEVDDDDDTKRERDTRGQELGTIACLLPRSKKKGALYLGSCFSAG